MRKKKVIKKGRSFKTLFIYGVFVFILVLISFSIRVFYLIEQSKFDGEHRYNLVIGDDKRVLGLVSFEPVTYSLSFLTFPRNSNLSFSDFNRKFGVIPDGYIKARSSLSSKGSIPYMLQSFLIHPNSIITNLNFYDFLRLSLYANKVPSSSIMLKEELISNDDRDFNKDALLLLTDSVVSAENISVQIVNATGKTGLGGRLERVVLNFGGNVVSVKNALVTESISKIQYYGQETYTLKKLERLLLIKKGLLEKEDIAKIVIIIGEDIKDTSLF